MSSSKLPFTNMPSSSGLFLRDPDSWPGDQRASSDFDPDFYDAELLPIYDDLVREVDISQDDFHTHAELLGKTNDTEHRI